MNKRHEEILNIMNRENEISVHNLSDILKVSLVTIRSDLRFLEEQQLVTRTHGGASLPSPDDISRRLSINYPIKRRIAIRAAEEIEEGETVFLEAGSCVALLAQELSGKKGVNIITNNAFIARQMKKSEKSNIILIGGVYQKESETLVGSLAKEYISYYNFTKVFMGIDGISMNKGFMCKDLQRAEIMAEFIRKGEKVYILSDSRKLGVSAVRTVCRPEEIYCLITDSAVSSEYQTFFSHKGIRLITV